jgi:hypothetical protein
MLRDPQPQASGLSYSRPPPPRAQISALFLCGSDTVTDCSDNCPLVSNTAQVSAVLCTTHSHTHPIHPSNLTPNLAAHGAQDNADSDSFGDVCDLCPVDSAAPAPNSVCPGVRTALEDLYTVAGGATWNFSTNWGTDDPCVNSWFGVQCDVSGSIPKVTYVALPVQGASLVVITPPPVTPPILRQPVPPRMSPRSTHSGSVAPTAVVQVAGTF